MRVFDVKRWSGGLPVAAAGRRITSVRRRAVAQLDDGKGEEEGFSSFETGGRSGDRSRLARPKRGRSGRGKSSNKAQLYTACIAFSGGPVIVQAFHASVARHPMEVVQRLRRRFGDEVIPLAEIRIGFHRASPLVVALVPEALADVIRKVERKCSSPEFGEFVVDIEHRIET